MEITTKKTKVYALFIGIDAYRGDIKLEEKVRFPPLQGCIPDVTAVCDFLKKDNSLQLEPLMVLNQDATKQGIINGFRNHLAKATKEDAVLIYYSGHGLVEYSNVWQSETDGRLEGLACYYDHADVGKFALADKELRFLLHELWEKTKAHIVGIFDCCHSGDNTRSVLQNFTGSNEDKPVQRRIDYIFKQRDWQDFIFANQFSQTDAQNSPTHKLLPEGQYIQLSASESNEPAEEWQGHGVFTVRLLEVLQQSNGFLSYNDLNTRIRNKLYYQYQQRPRIYTPESAGYLKNIGFLKKAFSESQGMAWLSFNRKISNYRMNRGAGHGVKANQTRVTVLLENGNSVTGIAKNVSVDACDVSFNNTDLTALNGADYPCALSSVETRPVSIRIVDKDQNRDFTSRLAEILNKPAAASYVSLTTEADNAEFDIVLWRNKAYITHPDDLARPLAAPLSMEDKKCLEFLEDYVKHISRWLFFNDLKNKGDNALDTNALKVEVFTVDNGIETPLSISGKNTYPLELVFDATKRKNKWRRNLKIKVTNQSAEDLYVAGLLNSYNFSTDALFLQPDGVKMLEKGESFYFEDRSSEPADLFIFSVDMKCHWYNWEYEPSQIKILYSNEPFLNEGFNLSGLPDPIYPNMESSGGAVRGGIKEIDEAIKGWNTIDFNFHIINPNYNKVASEEVVLMMNDSDCADFAQLLHFTLNEKFEPVLKDNETAQRGFLMDTGISLANFIASKRRNSLFKDMLKKHPERPRLVSEGDSWFQHPLLNDIIDNINVYLPTRCLAAAGDTIANYVKEGEYSTAIDEVNPIAFLLSGGGNDILGDSMRKFLVHSKNDIEDGMNPERFFNENYRNALINITDLYKIIFNIVTVQKPELHTLVHGYDYVRANPAGSNKTSWIGKYLDEFNITRPKDRINVVRFMIDGFNEALKKTAESYPKVHYIDLRGTVADNEWDDEIHPNNTGYQKVSLKFMRKLIELIGGPVLG